MQILGFIVSFLMGKLNKPSLSLKDSALEIFDEISQRSRTPILLSLGGLMAVVFFSAGFFYSLIDATSQYDRNGVVVVSSSFLSGIIIMILAGGAFIAIFSRFWPGQKEARFDKQTTHHAPPGGLEEALSLLILDFVKEREEKRVRRASHPQEEAGYAPPSSTEKQTHFYQH